MHAFGLVVGWYIGCEFEYVVVNVFVYVFVHLFGYGSVYELVPEFEYEC